MDVRRTGGGRATGAIGHGGTNQSILRPAAETRVVIGGRERHTSDEFGSWCNCATVAAPVSASPVSAAAPASVPEIYSDRVAPNRGEVARLRGGSPEGESAVQSALRWLAANQSADGRWDAAKFGGASGSGRPAECATKCRRRRFESRQRNDRPGAFGISRGRQHSPAWRLCAECSAWAGILNQFARTRRQLSRRGRDLSHSCIPTGWQRWQ